MTDFFSNFEGHDDHAGRESAEDEGVILIPGVSLKAAAQARGIMTARV